MSNFTQFCFKGIDEFAGIYLVGKFPKRCFVNNEKMIFSCPVTDTLYPVIFNLNNGQIKVLMEQPYLNVLDVACGVIVASRSTFTVGPHLVRRLFNDTFAAFIKNIVKL